MTDIDLSTGTSNTHTHDSQEDQLNTKANDELRAVKVILLGDQSVGKTSIRSQYIHHYFSNNYKATIGADFLSYKVKTKSNDFVGLQIWDTAGQERYNAVSRAFYRGCDIAILIYDITNSESFHNLDKWLNNFLKYCGSSQPKVMIIGNKSDCSSLRQISFRQAVEFAGHLSEGLVDDSKLDLIEVCARNYLDVEKIFNRCAEIGLVKVKEQGQLVRLDFDTVVDVSRPANGDKRWSRCC
ncbi:hypothetical protein CANARDRAFT_29481 [[Candida] arabinofermentans NRRL YB-2248]|uniref:Uncharacterized protein n=1 Tax=[Candida] arabinofermentans NRRL YB-2248 TaxID=983967 RepID=A0A1E4SWZ4_9ASCO|nr:hypothetical protein CANARDRAFT_29481 [[Candida] arabinofermentans NRRL YB-2248]